MKITPFCGLLVLVLALSCNRSKDKKEDPEKKDTMMVKPPAGATPAKAPIINIVDTVSPKRIVIYMKDSATTADRIGYKLGQIYGVKLAEVFKNNKTTSIAGQPMAWFKSQKAPFFFEAGIPVTKRPAKLPKGVFVREMNVDSVVVAHFYGPYDLTPQAYTAITEWMKDTKKRSKGMPYEIYVTDPLDKDGIPIDPYKVRTDIVFPRK